MSIFRDFFVKEKPVFTGITRGIGGFGFGAGGGSSDAPIKATGGTKYTNGSQTVHEFLSNSTLQVHVDIPAVTYLVVGGGGGGGGYTTRGGGGGAGGVRSNHPDTPAAIRTPSSYSLPSGTYPVVVGEGGLARGDGSGSWPSTNNVPGGGATAPGPGIYGTPGYSSIFNGPGVNSVDKIVGTGGGAGIWGGQGISNSATGGSGGGCGDWDSGGAGAAAVNSPDGLGPAVQGYAGGPSPPQSGSYVSGGGGGAGGAAPSPNGGKGGPSVQISIRGKNTTPVGEYYGGGGQGTGGAIPDSIVSDPGGSGGRFSVSELLPNAAVGDLPARSHASNGYPGTGGGGAGVSSNDGKGGPGIIVISYPT